MQLTGDSRAKPPVKFTLLDNETNKAVLSGTLQPQGDVPGWGDRTYRADFSGWQTPGRYVLQTTSSDGDVRSGPFIIGADLLERYMLSDVIAYFKSQRVTGLFDKADRNCRCHRAPAAVRLTSTAAGMTPPAITACTCRTRI